MGDVQVIGLNFEVALGKNLNPCFAPFGPATEAQMRVLGRLGWCADRLVARDDSVLRKINWVEELRGKRISYDGQELQTAAKMTWAQILPGLPAPGIAASVPAEALASGEVRRCLLDPERVLLDPREVPPGPKLARVWADDHD